MFEQLMTAETEENALEAEKFFLDRAKEAADADFQTNAFDVTAKFDEFRRLARYEYSQPFYAGFFATNCGKLEILTHNLFDLYGRRWDIETG